MRVSIASLLVVAGLSANAAFAQERKELVVLFDKHDFMLPMLMKELESLEDSTSHAALFGKVTCLNNLVSQMNTEVTVADVFSYFGAVRRAGVGIADDSLYKSIVEPLRSADLMLRVSENVVHDRIEFQFFLYRLGNMSGAGPLIQLDAPEYYNGWFVDLESSEIKERILSEFARMFPSAFPLPRFNIRVNGEPGAVHFVAVGDSVEVVAVEPNAFQARWFSGKELSWRREVLLETGRNEVAELFASGKRCRVLANSEQDVRIWLRMDDGIHQPAEWSVVLRFRTPTVFEVEPRTALFFTRPPLWGRTQRVRMPITLRKDTRLVDSSAVVSWSYGSAYGAYSSDTRPQKPLKPVTKFHANPQLSMPVHAEDHSISFFLEGTDASESPYLMVVRERVGLNEIEYEMLLEPELPMHGAIGVELNENGRVTTAQFQLRNVVLSPFTARVERFGTLYRLWSDSTLTPEYFSGLGGVRFGMGLRVLGPVAVILSVGANGAQFKDLEFDFNYYELGTTWHMNTRRRFLSDLSWGLSARSYSISYRDSSHRQEVVGRTRTTDQTFAFGVDLRSRPFDFVFGTPGVATLHIGYCPMTWQMGQRVLAGSLEVRLGLEIDGYPVRWRARSTGAHRKRQNRWNEMMGYPVITDKPLSTSDKAPVSF